MQSESSHSHSLAAVILAAGASSRMGRPKLLLPWGETTAIGHLIGQWQKLGAQQIEVVCRAGDAGLNGELDWLHFPAANRIVNPHPERGMFSSIQCAANWTGWQPGLTAWAVVLGDQPHLKFSTLETLLAFHRANPNFICQPEFAGHGRHPVILPPKAFKQLARSGAATLKDFLKSAPGDSRRVQIDDLGLGLDLDTPEDYERARGIHAGRPESRQGA